MNTIELSQDAQTPELDTGALSSSRLLELLESLTLVKGECPEMQPGLIGLSIPPGTLTALATALDLPMKNLLGRNFPWLRLQVSPALSEALATRGIYGADNPQQHYFVELMSNGRLFVRYQQISGSWKLGSLTPEELAAFVDKLKSLIREQYVTT